MPHNVHILVSGVQENPTVDRSEDVRRCLEKCPTVNKAFVQWTDDRKGLHVYCEVAQEDEFYAYDEAESLTAGCVISEIPRSEKSTARFERLSIARSGVTS